jgi:hypothetical protein
MAIDGEAAGPVYLSIESVAARYEVSKTTVRRWVKAGILPPPAQLGDTQRWAMKLLQDAESALDEAAMTKWCETAAAEGRAATDKLNQGAAWTSEIVHPPLPDQDEE